MAGAALTRRPYSFPEHAYISKSNVLPNHIFEKSVDITSRQPRASLRKEG